MARIHRQHQPVIQTSKRTVIAGLATDYIGDRRLCDAISDGARNDLSG